MEEVVVEMPVLLVILVQPLVMRTTVVWVILAWVLLLMLQALVRVLVLVLVLVLVVGYSPWSIRVDPLQVGTNRV